MEKVTKEAETQQEKRDRSRINVTGERELRLLRALLISCAGCAVCSTVSIGSVRGVTGWSGMAASMSDGRVMQTGQMDMEMPGVGAMAGVAVASHQADSQEETEAQQKAENEDQGKRISSDHKYSLLSQR